MDIMLNCTVFFGGGGGGGRKCLYFVSYQRYEILVAVKF